MTLKRGLLLTLAFSLVAVLFGVAMSTGRKIRRIPAGSWGGEHIGLEVTNKSATIEYDCAHGTIDGPLTLDSRGRFKLHGSHVREHGGPIRTDEPLRTQQARYTGWTDGKRMELTVTIPATKETIGTFSLERGREPRIRKCR
jgi:hypothetical protein